MNHELELLELVEISDLPEPYEQIARLISVEAAVTLAKAFGGEHVYMPKTDSIVQSVRDKKIIAEFDGYNYEALAKKYNLTSTWIRKIVYPVDCVLKRKPMDGQMGLV